MFLSVTRQQVRQCPPLGEHLPVSRQYEREYCRHYNVLPYWLGRDYWGHGAYPWAAHATTSKDEGADHESDESHLRSCHEVTGYHVLATDAPAGHVDDVLIYEANWTIPYLEIDTSNWIGGKAVLVPEWTVRNISWHERRIRVGLPRRTIHDSPIYEHADLPSLDERRFSSYYQPAE
jgi:hypothetical protein